MTTRWVLGIALIGLTVASPPAARAQEINLKHIGEAPNRFQLRTGAEDGFVAGVGYARAVPVLGRHLLVHGDLTVPWSGLDFADYRVRLGVLVPIVSGRGFHLAGTAAPTLRGLQNPAGRMTNVGLDIGLVGGYYARHWYVAGELGFDWAITTHITHSDRYRAQVYAFAKDGWYGNSGGSFRYGGQVGASFGRHDLVLRAGQARFITGNAHYIPLYATLTWSVRW